MPPVLWDQIDAAARHAGMSRSAWLDRTARMALDPPAIETDQSAAEPMDHGSGEVLPDDVRRQLDRLARRSGISPADYLAAVLREAWGLEPS